MANSNLPQGRISFTPDNELVVHYPKNTLKKRVFSHLRLVLIFAAILTTIGLLVAIYFNMKVDFISLILISILSFIDSPTLKKAAIERVTLTAAGLKYKYYNYKSPEIIQLEDSSYVDIKVKLLEDSTVELDIDDFLIYFDDVEKLPLVIDNIATTWNMEYHDTIHINDNQEILTYSSKSISNFKSNSRLKIENKSNKITFRDTLMIGKYIEVNKQTGKIFSHQNTKGIQLLNSGYSIRIAAYSNIGIFSKESEIRVNLVNPNGGLNTIFFSERRDKDEVVTTYRDVELIYDTLKALPILENVMIEKQFN